MWAIFAILSAVFAALTSILAKVGIDGVNSNLATALRTIVVLIMAWGMVFITNAQTGLGDISRKSWIFLILSGLAMGASWLFYYRALQMGDASKVVVIDKLSVVLTLVLAYLFLHEDFTTKSLVGAVLITVGTLVMVWKWKMSRPKQTIWVKPLRNGPQGLFLIIIHNKSSQSSRLGASLSIYSPATASSSVFSAFFADFFCLRSMILVYSMRILLKASSIAL